MRQDGPIHPPTEKTDANIKRATAHSLWIGARHIEWKLWTGIFTVRPIRSEVSTWFFNEGFVRWVRIYWLTFGVSITRPLTQAEEERDYGSNTEGL